MKSIGREVLEHQRDGAQPPAEPKRSGKRKRATAGAADIPVEHSKISAEDSLRAWLRGLT